MLIMSVPFVIYMIYIYIGTILCLPIRGIPTSTREMELAHVMYVSLKPWDWRCCVEMADGQWPLPRMHFGDMRS